MQATAGARQAVGHEVVGVRPPRLIRSVMLTFEK